MREYELEFKPFKFIDLIEYEGVKELSEHGSVRISGHIAKESVEEYLSLQGEDLWATIGAKGENGEYKVLFCGIIASLNIKVQNGVHLLTAVIKSGTYLMDHALHVRTYQNEGMTYQEILQSFTNHYQNSSFVMTEYEGATSSKFITQYRETDWQFAKRLASHYNTIVVPEMHSQGVKYYFGMPNSSKTINLNQTAYSVNKHLKDYFQKKERGLDNIQENDVIQYSLTTRDVYEIGDNLQVNGVSYRVVKIESKLIGSELYHTYSALQMNGIKVPKEYNAGLIGASLDSKILAVNKDMVQVSVTEDENQEKCGTRWFPYSTVYSSPDGTGWYCMPEIGDSVRVYMPTQDEAEAYVVSSTHLESENGEERCNPDNKSIMNKFGKEVLFTPNSLIMTNNKGMSVEILDDEGIKIISDKQIIIKSDEKIDVASANENVQIIAPSSVTLQQGDTITKLQKNVMLKGSQVNME